MVVWSRLLFNLHLLFLSLLHIPVVQPRDVHFRGHDTVADGVQVLLERREALLRGREVVLEQTARVRIRVLKHDVGLCCTVLNSQIKQINKRLFCYA